MNDTMSNALRRWYFAVRQQLLDADHRLPRISKWRALVKQQYASRIGRMESARLLANRFCLAGDERLCMMSVYAVDAKFQRRGAAVQGQNNERALRISRCCTRHGACGVAAAHRSLREGSLEGGRKSKQPC